MSMMQNEEKKKKEKKKIKLIYEAIKKQGKFQENALHVIGEFAKIGGESGDQIIEGDAFAQYTFTTTTTTTTTTSSLK